MHRAGSAWYPVRSFGTMTLYVDGASGADTADKGFASGSDAYATILYAISQIPATYDGNVTVNLSGATYSEIATVRGKAPTGNYTITLQGTESSVASFTATGGTQGSGASHGTVTYGTPGAWTNMWLKGTSGANNGVYRLIDSISGTTITIVGYWSAAPTGTDTFTVVEPGTTVDRIVAGDGQLGLRAIMCALNFPDASAFSSCAGVNGQVLYRYCRQVFSSGSNIQTDVNAAVVVEECYFERVRWFMKRANIQVRGSKFYRSQTAGSSGVALQGFSQAGIEFITRPSVIDGNSVGSTGIKLTAGANCEFNSLYCKIRNLAGGGTGRGIRAESTTAATNTVNVQYSGNDTDESADAASYGYID